MYCSKCGNKIRDGAQFCSNCGAPVRNRSIESYTKAVELALAGDERGFSYLYEQTYKSKYYLAMKYMGSREEAEDVLQDAYIKAFSKLNTLKEPETFPSWLGTILANTAKNALQKKNPVLFSDLPSSDEETDIPDFEIEDESLDYQPEAAYTRQETEELIREMIGSLSEEQKMCILMYYIDGESVRDIAEALDCSESAVKSRLSYGRKNLKAKAEEMQKKGYKLFTLAPIPLLFTLIHKDAEAAVCEKEFIAAGRRIAREVLQKATQIAKTAAASQAGGTGAAAHQAGTGTVVKVAAGAGAAGKGGAGAGAVVGFINTVAGKVVISVVVAVVVIGGIGGGVHAHRVNQSKELIAEYEEVLPETNEEIVGEARELEEEGGDKSELVDLDASNDMPLDAIATEIDDETMPSVSSMQELFDRIKYKCAEDLNLFYEYGQADYATKYIDIDADEAFIWVGYALDEPDMLGWEAEQEYRYYLDGKLYAEGELSLEQASWAEYYFAFPIAYYEEALTDLFGYDLKDYNLNDVESMVQDDDGNYYIYELYYRTDAHSIQNVTVSIEYISDEPDDSGNYIVIAKYEGDNITHGADQMSHETYFMQFQVRPDNNSKYGYVIAGMTPAGEGEIDESVSTDSDTNATSVDSTGLSEIETDNEGEESGTSTAGWKDMYREYITGTLEFYDTELGANCLWSLDPEGIYTFALIYVNDDDIPELLIFNENTSSSNPYAYRLSTIRDGMFKDVNCSTNPVQNFSYIERGSLFYESYVQDGNMYDRVARIINYLGPWSVDSEYVYDLYYYSDTGEYRMDYGEEKIGENSYYYTWINLTKDEYENNKSQLKAYFKENNAITPEMMSEEELLKMLE